MNAILKEMINDASVGGILLDIDSPGGEASFTPVLGSTIKNNSVRYVYIYVTYDMFICHIYLGDLVKL